MGVAGVIVGVVVMFWLASVVVICAGMKRVTRPPWWEALLLDLDALLAPAFEHRRPNQHRHAMSVLVNVLLFPRLTGANGAKLLAICLSAPAVPIVAIGHAGGRA